MNRRGLLAALAAVVAAPVAAPGPALAAVDQQGLYQAWQADAGRWYDDVEQALDAYGRFLAEAAVLARSDWRGKADPARSEVARLRRWFQSVAQEAEGLSERSPPPVIETPSLYTAWSVTMAAQLGGAQNLLITAVRRLEAGQPTLLGLIEQAGAGDEAAIAALDRRALDPVLRGLRLRTDVADVLNVPHRQGAPGGKWALSTAQLYTATLAAALQAVADAEDGKPLERARLAKDFRGKVRTLQSSAQAGEREFGPQFPDGVASLSRFAGLLADPASTPDQWRRAIWLDALVVLDPTRTADDAGA